MSDFYQGGVITTMHNLVDRPVHQLEDELCRFNKTRPLTLVLPCLYSELEGPAMGPILETLRELPYLHQIIIGLDRADEAQYRAARDFFSALPQQHRVIWNDGPRMQAINQRLSAENLAPKELGKGCNVWYSMGYLLSTGTGGAVGLHDCDIVTYDRALPARLLYPVAHPAFNYQFCKGYYSRIANGALNGRVCRLLVTPLLRTLKTVFGPLDYLEYMDSFRYALAGEFSMRLDVVTDLRIPSDWGLEIGVLSEMYRNYSTNRICQADIADVYDHKHQQLSPQDATQGLSKMSIDIIKALYRKLATTGVVFTNEHFRSIKATYFRIALDFIETYANDATMNGLKVDIHAEEKAVEMFAQNIVRAGKHFLDHPMETPFIPSWNRVVSAIDGILPDIRQAVDEDHTQYA
ncbi:MAG: glycosyl transferase [Oceanococcus sp.]|nr:MAG: glycosyl transferase [Oceanococcus sp.]